MINLVHLYPAEMNIYGDTGNRIVLEKRMQWRGIAYKTHLIGVGQPLPKNTDIILGGGGQDAGQQLVEKDVLKRAGQLRAMAQDGVAMLMICGMYQLFGEAFITADNVTIRGAKILPLITRAGEGRLIGNTVVQTEWGELVGYENHSGRTTLDPGCLPLGKVIKGAGNNGMDKTEGAHFYNVFGSYMHGPLLSKNPHFADVLIKLALKRRGERAELAQLDDSLEQRAHEIAHSRPR